MILDYIYINMLFIQCSFFSSVFIYIYYSSDDEVKRNYDVYININVYIYIQRESYLDFKLCHCFNDFIQGFSWNRFTNIKQTKKIILTF